MPASPLRCGRCRTVLRGATLSLPEPAPCPSCGARTLARVFPAFFWPDAIGQTAPAVGSAEDASCFFHPRKKATAACERCGRFLCALCDLEIGGTRLCPSCAAGDQKPSRGRLQPLENETVLYDHIAWSLAFWPLFLVFTLWLIWPVYLITAGATFYIVVRHWQDPAKGYIPRGQGRMALAAALGVVQLAVAAVCAWFSVTVMAQWLR